MRLLPLAAVFALIFAFAVPGTMLGSHAGPLTASCTNPEIGYTVNFPNNWFYNTHVTGEGAAEDVEACRYFSSEDFTVTPGSEPTGVSIGMSVENEPFDASEGEAVTVGGRDAVRQETEVTTPGFEGTYYTYRIDLNGQRLVAQTVDTWVGDYEENKDILDAMMETLEFGTQATPTPAATPTPEATALPDAAMPANTGTGASLAAVALFAGLLFASGLTVVAVRRH